MWLAHCQRSPSELQVTANKIVLLLILLYSPHKIDRWSVLYIYIYTMYILYIMYVIYIWYYILYALDVSLANVTTDYLDVWNQFTNLLNFTWIVIIWLDDFSGFGCHDCQCPGMGNLNWEDYFSMDCFSRESSWNQRGKYLVKLIIKIA